MHSLTKLDGEIYIFQKDTNQQGVFNEKTGIKVRGDLDMKPEDVLFLAWKQTQPPKLTESQLLKKWKEVRHG